MTGSISVSSEGSCVGILLAAGRGTRFDASGRRSKLLEKLPNGDAVVVAAGRNLRASMPLVLAVVPPGADAMTAELHALGCSVSICPHAADGMAASLVHALSLTSRAAGWLIALGDMPHVQPATMASLRDALLAGVDIAAPVYRGRRGNPVAFSPAHLSRLLQLNGDQGGRKLLQEFPAVELDVDDPGILHDIDTPQDLLRLPDRAQS